MRRFGLIGKTLTHSFSKRFFQLKFKQEEIGDSKYDLFELPSIEYIKDLFELDYLVGFNVTIPYKEEVIPFLDSISAEAKQIGAVNCVHLQGGQWKGYNTDVFGFQESFRKFTKEQVSTAIILGNGGSAKAVKQALKNLGISYKVVSRTGDLNYDNLHPSIIRELDAIINTTPLGMSPNQEDWPDIDYEAINGKHFVFDLIYNPEETYFLRKARLAGAQTKNGQEMLELQALKSWEIWNSEK